MGVQFGAALRQRFPEAEAKRKLQAHVSLYIDGFRPDLGIYSAVNFIFRVLKGEFRVESVTDEEKLEEASTTGRSAGAIFTLCLAPYLSLVIGMLWGLYATNYRVQCTTRLFLGGLLGSGVAIAVAMIMVSLGRYGYDLWYFILAASILLAAAGRDDPQPVHVCHG